MLVISSQRDDSANNVAALRKYRQNVSKHTKPAVQRPKLPQVEPWLTYDVIRFVGRNIAKNETKKSSREQIRQRSFPIKIAKRGRGGEIGESERAKSWTLRSVIFNNFPAANTFREKFRSPERLRDIEYIALSSDPARSRGIPRGGRCESAGERE